MGRPITRQQQVVDSVIALVFTVVGFLQLWVPNDDGYTGGPLPLNVAISVLTTLPLAVRRRWPGAVALVVFGAHILPNPFVAHTTTFWGGAVPMAVVMYTVGRLCPTRQARWLLLLPLVAFTTYGIHTPEFRRFSDLVFPIVLFGAAWAAGQVIARLTRQREALDDALGQLAEQQEAHGRQAVLEERTRIAREMHDVVAHGVSVMVVQAGSARLELADDGSGDLAAARTSLLAVEASGREVLGELRRTVSLLRAPSDADGGAAPSPGLSELPSLVESMRTAGLSVTLEVDDGAGADPGRELAVYRIVQEALTNTLRHAGRTRVAIRVTADPLAVEVTDGGRRTPGAGARPGGGGNGVVGMRERVAMYGGTFHAGGDDTGFVVRATIPREPR